MKCFFLFHLNHRTHTCILNYNIPKVGFKEELERRYDIIINKKMTRKSRPQKSWKKAAEKCTNRTNLFPCLSTRKRPLFKKLVKIKTSRRFSRFRYLQFHPFINHEVRCCSFCCCSFPGVRVRAYQGSAIQVTVSFKHTKMIFIRNINLTHTLHFSPWIT